MEGTMDATEFALAENLGMTVRALRETMGQDEYLAWRAYYTWRKAMLDMEAKTPQ